MPEPLKGLSAKDYPGRLIIIGRDESGKNEVVIYAITGRSSSSQARKLENEGQAIWAKPTDEGIIRKGKKELLIYPAILLSRGIAVGNGKQTEDIRNCLGQNKDPARILASAFEKWDYEPDSPHFTPRIGGCLLPQERAALGIIKRAPDGSSERNIFDVQLKAGKGKMITTYEGEDRSPLPSFRGEPIDVMIKGRKAVDLAEEVYAALEPEQGKKDYRVSVACVFSRYLAGDEYEIYIINRHERMKK